MKIIIALLIFALSFIAYLPTWAQFKQIAESATFADPKDGSLAIVQMKSGNTFYLHLTSKEGIDLRIYDATHKEKVSAIVIPSFGKLRAGTIDAFFEVKNDIVLFVSEYEDNAPKLYRLIFDGNTGKLKEDKLLVEPKRRSGLLAPSVMDVFNIKKNAAGENYVVEVFHIYEDDRNKRIEIIQYGDDNNETNRNFLTTGNDDDYKFFVYIDMCVIDENKVNIILYNRKDKFFNTTIKEKMVMACIDKKSNKINYINIDLPEGIKFSNCITQYNAKTKKIYLILRELNKRDRNNYDNYLVKINTETNRMETKLLIDSDEKLDEEYKKTFSLKRNYLGMLHSFLVNEDDSYTVIYEEKFSRTTQVGSYTYGDEYTGKIMILNYNNNGEVLSGYVVPKLYNVNSTGLYKSFLYINAGKNKYIAINDTERNNEVKKDKFVEVNEVNKCDAFLYPLRGNELVPKRDYIFGSGETGNNIASFRVSDYNKITNTLVTLKLNKKTPTDNAATLVWMQPL